MKAVPVWPFDLQNLSRKRSRQSVSYRQGSQAIGGVAL